jgi:cobalt-zinc-cadmium efflux system protein
MSAHILTDDLHISAGAQIRRRVSETLRQRYNIVHATLQLECVDCFPDSLYCDLNCQPHVDDVHQLAQHSSR